MYLKDKNFDDLIKTVILILMFLMPGILDIYFYYEYTHNEPVTENIEVLEVENKILRPYSDFLSKSSHRRCRAVFLKASNGESYLIANTFWEKQFKDGVYLSKVIRIRYIDTMRYKIITSIENLQYPYY